MQQELPVRVIRSTRRRKTVEAAIRGGVMELRVPARSTEKDIEQWTQKLKTRLVKSAKKRTFNTDAQLAQRTEELRAKYLPEAPSAQSIEWVTNQNSRWGSCSIASRRIRLSHRMKDMPPWVVDYVIVHELAHLIETRHSAKFKSLVKRYPKSEKAQGFLEGSSWASRS
ncbi:MAG: M48 family metallopeptidase [Micrococcaceae bacterium]